MADPAPLASAVEPDLAIVDCHHHLWLPGHPDYLIERMRADIAASGHAVVATVYVECNAMYRRTGPERLRAVGEAQYASGMAAMSESGAFGETRICAGFVGAADPLLGDEMEDVLDALAIASGGRLRGIRRSVTWDADPVVGGTGIRRLAEPGVLLNPRFREGLTRLAGRGLVYDAWQYYPQLEELCALADAVPEATIVIDHCGGLVGVGRYAEPGNFDRWRAAVAETARRPNMLMKIGGLSASRTGFGFEGRQLAPGLETLVACWRPYVETCIAVFGADRCMFESNFPVDSVAGSYGDVWNAFKTIVSGCSAEEKRLLFADVARRTYRLDIDDGDAP